MRKTYGSVAAFIVVMITMLTSMALEPQPTHAAPREDASTITEWEMLWEQPGEERTIEEVAVLDEGWFTVHADGEFPSLPEGIRSAWIKFRLPELTQMRPALEMNKLYAKSLAIYIDNEIIYERNRGYFYDLNELLLPVEKNESHQYVYMQLQINVERLGLYDYILVGEYDTLLKSYIKDDLLDVVLGAALIFIAFFMMVSIVFLKKAFLPGWYSVFLVMLSIGIMILTYSSFLDKFFPEYGSLFYIMFDVASSLLLPALFSFFENIFGKGPYGLISKFKKILIYFSIIYLLMLILSQFSEMGAEIYFNFGFVTFVASLLIGNIVLIGSLIYQCKTGNKEAIIIAFGLSLFAGVGFLEILWYLMMDTMYSMFYWKISILCFLASLIIILVRRIMHNYEQAVQYSKQIEIFNNELQRSEKIELISHLAASIAHEVRNPLQVTRGFLQLLGDKMEGSKDRNYMKLAVNELDRASEIITDFLTFAKPDLGEIMKLNTSEEIHKIVAILSPFATMQGGVIHTDAEPDLYVRGNASRFKQALINLIKNSIEAFNEDGEVKIIVYLDHEPNEVVIKLIDNGEGIEADDIKRLGEPYYSKKSKGTGLGLMVTFRIIEAMNGSIEFNSTKGAGTEVTIRLPHIVL